MPPMYWAGSTVANTTATSQIDALVTNIFVLLST